MSGSWKVGVMLVMGATATVEIAAPARSRVVLSGGAAVTFHSCPRWPGFFPQIFTFLHGQVRGCVPLDIAVSGEPRVRHVTLSLGAGSCGNVSTR